MTIDGVSTIERAGGVTTGVISDQSLGCSTAVLISWDNCTRAFLCYLRIVDRGEILEEIAR